MKLYATITSERASKGQGGNKRLDIQISLGKEREDGGVIAVREIEPNVYNIAYFGGGESRQIVRIETKGKRFTKLCTGCGAKTFSFEPGAYGWEDGWCDKCWDKKGKKQKGECPEGGDHFTVREGNEEICRKCLNTI